MTSTPDTQGDRAAEIERRLQRLKAVGQTLSDTLRMYGFPVSEAHWKNASGRMSCQDRALHLAAESFAQALKDPS